MGIIFCILFINRPFHDFGNYYFGSKFALQGVNIRDIYEPYKFNLLIRSQPGLQYETFLENYAVVPPFSLLFYLPFSLTSIYISKVIFNLFSVLLFCFFLFRLFRQLNINSKLIFLLPIIFFIPIKNNILFGQAYLLITGLLMGGFVAEERKMNWVAAIFYSLAIALKISPAILIFYLLARKNLKALGYTLIITTLFFFSAIYFTGWNFMMDYILHYIPKMAVNEINNPYATNYQSVTVLLRNVFVPDALLNPAAPIHSAIAYLVLGGCITGILFFLFANQLQKNKNHFFLFAFALMAGCLFPAYTSSYSLVFLIPICIDSISRENKKTFFILALVFLVCSLPLSAFQSLPLLLRFPRLYLLLILFFVLPDKPVTIPGKLKWLAASIVFFIGISFLLSKKPNSEENYFLDKEVSLLSYDFEFRGNTLFLKTLSANGPDQKSFQLEDSVYSVQPLLQNDYQLLASDGNILKAVLINNKQIVYLSDCSRGIGFYALRKLDLPNR